MVLSINTTQFSCLLQVEDIMFLWLTDMLHNICNAMQWETPACTIRYLSWTVARRGLPLYSMWVTIYLLGDDTL